MLFVFKILAVSLLREINVFGLVCLSFCPQRGQFHVTITHDALDLITQGTNLPRPPTRRPQGWQAGGSHPTGILSYFN